MHRTHVLTCTMITIARVHGVVQRGERAGSDHTVGRRLVGPGADQVEPPHLLDLEAPGAAVAASSGASSDVAMTPSL
jgi:hypothetical protein